MGKMIQNAVMINGHILNSVKTHDFKVYKDEDGNEWNIDGGLDYCHTNIMESNPGYNKLKIEWLLLDEDSSLEDKVQKLLWGTFGKGVAERCGKEIVDITKQFFDVYNEKPLNKQGRVNKMTKIEKFTEELDKNKKELNDNFKWILLRDCETDHLEAIKKNCQNISLSHKMVIDYILAERKST